MTNALRRGCCYVVRGAALMFAGVLLAPLAAYAQSSDTPKIVQLRNDCRLAQQVITKGHPAPKYAWAMGVVSSCGTDGAETLAGAWARPPADTESLDVLVAASRSILDAGLLEAVLRTAQDETVPTQTRAAALTVLARYVVPKMLVPYPELLKDYSLESPVEYPLFGEVSHWPTDTTSRSLAANTPVRVVDVMRELMSSPNAMIASAATILVAELKYRVPPKQ